MKVFFSLFSLVKHSFVRSYELEHTSTMKIADSLNYDTHFGVEFFDFDVDRFSSRIFHYWKSWMKKWKKNNFGVSFEWFGLVSHCLINKWFRRFHKWRISTNQNRQFRYAVIGFPCRQWNFSGKHESLIEIRRDARI